MSRPTAPDRLRRLLALIPWIVEHPGSTIEEICARFELAPEDLHADLEVVWMVGLPPYTPDQLVDVVMADDRVWIHLGDFFRSPLRLTPDQALALVVAGRGLSGVEADGPLQRGLAKLAGSLGVEDPEAVAVHLGDASADLVERLRGAVADRRQVEIDYYSYGRDERAHRVVDPHRVFAEAGQWYLAGNCHMADGDRLFRVDRIGDLRVLDERFEPPDMPVAGFDLAGGTTVKLAIRPAAHWVLDQYPHGSVERVDEDTTTVELQVMARPWLERLLLQLGPDAEVIEIDGRPGHGSVRRDAASRVLGRYR